MQPQPAFNGSPVQQVSWSPGVSLDSLIDQVVRAAYSFYKGNKTATAQALGISIRTLDNKLSKIEKEETAHVERTDQRQKDRAEFQARQRAVPQGAQYDTASTPTPHNDPKKYRNAPHGNAPHNGPSANDSAGGAGVRPQPASGNPTE